MRSFRLMNGILGTIMSRFHNQVLIGIASGAALAILVAISMMVARGWFQLGWFQLGSPNPGGWGTLLSAVVGGGSFVAFANWFLNLRRTGLTQQQIELSSRNSRYDRFQRGIEMLGNPELFVRLGGIYALRTLMEEDPDEFHVPTVELLCAFLRNPIDGCDVVKGSRVRQDIKTALEVIVRRGEEGLALEKTRGFQLDLRSANLQYAEIPGVDFSRANLEGTIFSGANMDGANMSTAKLVNVDLSFANCRKSNFRNTSLRDANLRHVSIGESDFSGAYLNWVNCSEGSFHKTDFAKARIYNCDFKGALLYGTDLTRAYLASGNMLTQKQLDDAVADPDAPPFIDTDLVDLETGEPVNWRGTLPYPPYREEMQKRVELARSNRTGRSLNLVFVNRINGKPPTKPQAGYF